MLLLLLLTLSKHLSLHQLTNALSVGEVTATGEAVPESTWQPATVSLSRPSVRDGTPLGSSSIARSVLQQRIMADTVRIVP